MIMFQLDPQKSSDVSSESEEDDHESSLSNVMHATTRLNNHEEFNDSLMQDESVEEVKILGKTQFPMNLLPLKKYHSIHL